MSSLSRSSLLGCICLPDEGAAGEITVDDQFEDVVVQAGLAEVPVVVVGLVEEVEVVEPLDPAHLDLHVEVFRVVLVADTDDRLAELFRSDRVGVGDDRPVRGVPVDAGDLVGGELEDREFDIGSFESDTDSEAGQQEKGRGHRASPFLGRKLRVTWLNGGFPRRRSDSLTHTSPAGISTGPRAR